jgi:hypothetical protein
MPLESGFPLNKYFNNYFSTVNYISMARNWAIENLLKLEKTKRRIFRHAIDDVHDYGFSTPPALATRFLLHDGGIDNFQRMLTYNRNYVSGPLRQSVREPDARLTYDEEKNRRHPVQDSLKRDPENETWISQ